MLKCRITDAECGTDASADFVGKLTDDAARLTQTVIDMLDLQMVLEHEKLECDTTDGQTRTLIWSWKDGTPMPIVFNFTEGRAE